MKGEASKVLECLLCQQRYSMEDIRNGLYQLETLVCSACYAKMQRQPHHISCFGKPTFILLNGKHLYGYNPKAEECRTKCPDRRVCSRIILGGN